VTSQRIRVLVVDDHLLVRRSIVRLLRECSDMEVVGEAADGLEAVEKARSLANPTERCHPHLGA